MRSERLLVAPATMNSSSSSSSSSSSKVSSHAGQSEGGLN
jgi:hypothetical protein